jgi:hypothetical protein
MDNTTRPGIDETILIWTMDTFCHDVRPVVSTLTSAKHAHVSCAAVRIDPSISEQAGRRINAQIKIRGMNDN